MFKHILPDANRRLLLGALILDFDRLQCCKACSLQETECHLSDQSCKCWRYRICHPDARHNDNDQTNWPNKLQEKKSANELRRFWAVPDVRETRGGFPLNKATQSADCFAPCMRVHFVHALGLYTWVSWLKMDENGAISFACLQYVSCVV